MLKQIVARVGLILLGVGLGILILEIGLKASCSQDMFQEPHELYGFFNIPGKEGWSCGNEFMVYARINSRGLRDREYTYEKPEHSHRILVLGDSFAEALQVPVETAFPKQLETLLTQQSGGNSYEVINAGVEEWGTAQELLFFRHEGYKYNPDLVLLMFYIGNDVLENSIQISSAWRERRPYFTWRQAESSLGEIVYAGETEDEEVINPIKEVLRNSRLYWLVRDRVIRSPSLSKFLVENGVMTNFFDGYSVYLTDPSPELEEGWAVTQALLKQLQAEVEVQNANLVVVIIPSFAQVSEEAWNIASNIYLPPGSEADPVQPDNILLQFLETEEMAYLHLLPYFREQPAPIRQSLYLPHDGHWSPEGHSLVTQAIFDYLIEQGLVSAAPSKEP